jgi:hypothetical protein
MTSVRRWLGGTDPLVWILGALAVALFTYIYVIDPGRPGEFTPVGWFGFADQGQYLQMTRELSEWGLGEDSFRYGLGYPILAVPFLWIGLDYDPFAIINGIAFVFTIVGTYTVGVRLQGRLLGGIAALGLLFATPLVSFTVQPWNSTVSLIALVLVLLIATSPRIGLLPAVGLGVAVGMAFAARYVDVVFVGAVALAAVTARRREWHGRDIFIAAGVGLAIIAVVLVAHQIVLGSAFTTPYESHVRGETTGSDQDLSAYRLSAIPESTFGMFVSPFLLGQRYGGEPMLQGAFWFLLAIPGVFVAWRRLVTQRAVLVTSVVASVISVLLYASFQGAGAGSVQFGSLHYFKMWWPLWALLAGLATTWLVSLRWPARWREIR